MTRRATLPGRNPAFCGKTLLAAACFVALTASAAPDSDFLLGEQAYRQGDVTSAMAALRKAADAGHAKAQALLAEILDRAELNEQAVSYFRRSAEQGEPEGEFGLARMYAAGEGVSKDSQRAFAWFQRAAEHGHSQAVKVVAGAYIFGGLGIDETARNSELAAKWIGRAAEAEFLPAVEAMAKAYRSGAYGIQPAAAQAEVWEARLAKLSPAKAGRGKINK